MQLLNDAGGNGGVKLVVGTSAGASDVRFVDWLDHVANVGPATALCADDCDRPVGIGADRGQQGRH